MRRGPLMAPARAIGKTRPRKDTSPSTSTSTPTPIVVLEGRDGGPDADPAGVGDQTEVERRPVGVERGVLHDAAGVGGEAADHAADVLDDRQRRLGPRSAACDVARLGGDQERVAARQAEDVVDDGVVLQRGSGAVGGEDGDELGVPEAFQFDDERRTEHVGADEQRMVVGCDAVAGGDPDRTTGRT